MADEKLTRLLEAAREWSSAAEDLARSQDLSIAAIQRDSIKNSLDISRLSDDAKNYRQIDMWIKGVEVFAAVVSLIVAIVVGYAATRLSAEANGIQTSLAQIGAAQEEIARTAEKRTASNELSDTIRDLGKPDPNDPHFQNNLDKIQGHEDVIRLLGIGSYNSLMKYVFSANKGRFIEYWGDHPNCIKSEDCSFNDRAGMFEVNLYYLGLIAHNANQFPGDEKKAADELSTLCKLPDSVKTTCDTLTESLSPFAKEAAKKQQQPIPAAARRHEIPTTAPSSDAAQLPVPSVKPPPQQ
jgi:hypothetical protein